MNDIELKNRINWYIADKIKYLRTNMNGGRGISQYEFGKVLGENANTISRWETGEYKPSGTDLIKICIFFNIPATEFFPEVNPSLERERFLVPANLSEEDKLEIENFIRFKEWKRAPDRKSPGRKKR